MKKSREKTNKKGSQKLFYKTNPRGGISLIVLVITIMVVIILAAAVIISLQNNNPMVEANKARIESDVANMQSIFTNTVGKIMAENQDVVEIEKSQLNTVTSGKKTVGIAVYKIKGTDGTAVVEGQIKFEVGNKTGTTYYTGKELPLYSSETKWYVDDQGLISVEVGGQMYGEGSKVDSPPVEETEITIAESDNPMIKEWKQTAYSLSQTEFYRYRGRITKIKFELCDKVSKNKVESWDISQSQDKSVMAWIESDGNNGYILIIAGKNKIIANQNLSYLFYNFSKLKEVTNLELLDTSNVKTMMYMFCRCGSLTSMIFPENFSTINVTDMSSMFESCTNLQELNISSFNTANVTNIREMFKSCENLETLELGDNFDTSKVEYMVSVFDKCEKLTALELGDKFNTSSVINMSNMFNECSTLVNLNVGDNFDTSKVTTMENMFRYCKKLETLELGNKFNTSNVDRMSNMFYMCLELTTLGENFEFNVYASFCSGLFERCKKLSAVVNIREINFYTTMFYTAASDPNAKIVVNYVPSLVNEIDEIIATKASSDSNVIKGTQID